jgi:hypothetical protein
MSFMNNINQTISDNMNFLKQYKANPEKFQTKASPSAGSNAQMQQLMPMIMMMMFQLLSQLTAQGGQNGGMVNQDPFAGLPTTLPLQPLLNPLLNPNPTTGAGSQMEQNPAYQALSRQLPGLADPAPDFAKPNDLVSQLNGLLSTSHDPALLNLGSQLNKMNPDAPQWAELKNKADLSLKTQGRSDGDIEKVDLLMEGLQKDKGINQYLAEQQQIAQNLEPDSIELVQSMQNQSQATQALAQNQQRLSQQWQAISPAQPSVQKPLETQVREGLAAHQFTPLQLGQSLKYLLDTAPNASAGPLGELMTHLVKSGDLNLVPFLQSNYLDKLSPERRTVLLNAMERAGLTRQDQKPNSRLAGYVLETISKPGDSSAKSFLQQYLQKEWTAQAPNPNAPEGKALIQVLELAGIQHHVGQPLTFS